MTDNVKQFPKRKRPTPQDQIQPPAQELVQQPPPGIIMCLEDMLLKARAGELTSLMIVATCIDPRIAVFISGSGLGFDTYNMLGGLARATQRLTKILDERELVVDKQAPAPASVEPPCDVEPKDDNDGGYNGA